MSETRIYGAMLSIMREIGGIEKDRNNQQQGFKYRGIDQVYAAIHPLMIKHGVFMRAEILDKHREERTNAKGTVMAFTTLRIRYHFVTDDGSSICTEAEGEGMDSGDKSSNKAMAIAHKYAILQAFCVPTEQVDDPDAEAHELATNKRGSKEAAKEVAKQKIERLKTTGESVNAPIPEDKLAETTQAVENNKFKEMLGHFAELKKQLNAASIEGEYYAVLGGFGVEHANEFRDFSEARKCFKALSARVIELKRTEQLVNA